jgi:hypothetical protein
MFREPFPPQVGQSPAHTAEAANSSAINPIAFLIQILSQSFLVM